MQPSQAPTPQNLAERLVALGERAHRAPAGKAFTAALDYLRPQRSISTAEYARSHRKFIGQTGDVIDYDESITPYLTGICETCDLPGVQVVGVVGNSRSGKTTSAETFLLNRWEFGPRSNVLWLMQDKDAINDYVDERGDQMLRIHPGVARLINWQDRKNGRNRMEIGGTTMFRRAATFSTTRGKAAPVIVADEIDAYNRKVRGALLGLLRNRQREFGTGSFAYIASHPDAGPNDGIGAVLKASLLHLWHWNCPECKGAASPSPLAETRWTWNVDLLLAQHQEEMERLPLLDLIEREARIICPHCKAGFDGDQRLAMARRGRWLQPHQTLSPEGEVIGERRISATMGFAIHAFMSPFVQLGEIARGFANARITSSISGDDTDLREQTVKTLGEFYEGTKDEEKIEDWKVIQARLGAQYALKTVPRGVDFLTAFVDVQGDRFEVRVIGWSRSMESWLIDVFAVKQWPSFRRHAAFENIDPGNRLTDWDVIEDAVLHQSYPLTHQPGFYLPIAKTLVNAAGAPGVTNNARVWLSNLLARQGEPGEPVVQQYRVQLFGGADKGELYGIPKQKMVDDNNKPLKVRIYERMLNVTGIKKIIAKRMRLGEPGPGAMHFPSNLSPRFIQELVAERFENGAWVKKSIRNETWDGWVACEAARALLQPDRPGLWDVLPEWATPAPRGQGLDTRPSQAVSMFDRLAEINQGTSLASGGPR